MNWTVLEYGKHRGKSLPQVILADPDWFYWAYEEDFLTDRLRGEVLDIYRKSRAIKVPPKNGERYRVEYIVDPKGIFGTINLIPVSSLYTGRYEVKSVIDMRYPRQLKKYDKTGYKNLLAVMRRVLFGEKRTRLTRRRCEEFFENPANFQLKPTSASHELSVVAPNALDPSASQEMAGGQA